MMSIGAISWIIAFAAAMAGQPVDPAPAQAPDWAEQPTADMALLAAGGDPQPVAVRGEPAKTEPGIVEPDWAEVPTAHQIRAYFPPEAFARKVSGGAMIHCRVTAKGRASGCVVKSETPPGWGFGEAALRLAPGLRFRPQTRDGWPTDGGDVTVPINFTIHGTVVLDCAMDHGRARGCVAVEETPPDRGMGPVAAAFAEGRRPRGHGFSVRSGRLRWRLDTPAPTPQCAEGETRFPCGGPGSR